MRDMGYILFSSLLPTKKMEIEENHQLVHKTTFLVNLEDIFLELLSIISLSKLLNE